MKYRKKPVVIDAVQWTGTNHREMFDFLTDYQCTDQYMSAEGKNFYIDHNNCDCDTGYPIVYCCLEEES